MHELWKIDQGVRKIQSTQIKLEYGENSKEFKEYLEKYEKTNSEAFYKIKAYLEIHGYPKQPDKYHKFALNAFPIIIGHNHNYENQAELLPYLYKGYKENHCSLEDVVWLMGEMYESKYKGRRYEMSKQIFRTEDEFKELSSALNLKLVL